MTISAGDKVDDSTKLQKRKEDLVRQFKSGIRDNTVHGITELFKESGPAITTIKPAQTWFRSLPPDQRLWVEWCMKHAIDGALNRMVCAFDGAARWFADDEHRNVHLELYWVNSESNARQCLNDPEDIEGAVMSFREIYASTDTAILPPHSPADVAKRAADLKQ